MSDAIKSANQIRARLQQAALPEQHLDGAGTHVVTSDGEELHVLLKDTKANAKIDTLEAELRDDKGRALKQLEVREVEELDLGELGKWRRFAVEGLAGLERAAALEVPPELHLVARGEGLAPEKAFHTTLDLPFALYEVLQAEQAVVRPIPPGQRGGREFVELERGQKGVLHDLLGRWFDDTVPAETMLAAAERWRELQEKVYSTGLIGALTLGLSPRRPEVPVSRVDGRDEVAKLVARAQGEADAGDPFGLGAALTGFLEQRGIALPERALTAKWAEETLDQVTELPAVPDEVVASLRKLFRELKDKQAHAKQAMFGGGGGAGAQKAPKQIGAGELRLAQAEAIKLDRLVQALDKLEVPGQEIRRLARELAVATSPRKYPSVLFFAGPRHSAAERMMETSLELIGKTPLSIDLSDPGFAQAFGHYKGVPTQGDGALSEVVLAKARGSQAAHLAITVDLDQVGSAANDEALQKAALVDWLERVDEMVRTGETEAFSRGAKPIAERRSTSLANTVFVLGWRRAPEELVELLEGRPNLQHLASKVFGTGELKPTAGVANLEAELTFRLRQHYGPRGAEVKLGPEVRAALEAAFHELGSTAAHDRFAEQLFVETYLVAKEHPAKEYVVHFSGGLTQKDKQKLSQGQALAYAANLWGIEPR